MRKASALPLALAAAPLSAAVRRQGGPGSSKWLHEARRRAEHLLAWRASKALEPPFDRGIAAVIIKTMLFASHGKQIEKYL